MDKALLAPIGELRTGAAISAEMMLDCEEVRMIHQISTVDDLLEAVVDGDAIDGRENDSEDDQKNTEHQPNRQEKLNALLLIDVTEPICYST
ncbi:hypothetical protein BGX27_004009, partial [Mortierella sp. AM989]